MPPFTDYLKGDEKTGDEPEYEIAADYYRKWGYRAPVMKTEPYEYGNLKGDLVTLLVENYGTTQPFFCSGGLTADGITERSQLSGIPKEYVNKQGKDFNWGLYGQDVTPQKKLVNAFVQQFKEFQKQGRGLYISSKAKDQGKPCLPAALLMK